jgi:hypothetical protein
LSRFESRWICGNTLNFSSCSVFRRFQTFASQIVCLEIQYLLRLWVVGHPCHLVDSTNLVDHNGGIPVQIGALVELQWELQYANMSTNLDQFGLAWNPANNSKSVENQKKMQLQMLFQITPSLSTIFGEFFSALSYFFEENSVFGI